MNKIIVILVALAAWCLCACSREVPHARVSVEQINSLHSHWHRCEQAGKTGELNEDEIDALINELDRLSKEFEVKYEDMVVITGRDPDISDKESWTAEYFLINDKCKHSGVSFWFLGKGHVMSVKGFHAID